MVWSHLLKDWDHKATQSTGLQLRLWILNCFESWSYDFFAFLNLASLNLFVAATSRAGAKEHSESPEGYSAYFVSSFM